jgi:hypothetical protein
MKTSGAWLCSIAWALGACGAAASDDYDLPAFATEISPVATMRGRIVGSPEVQRERLKIALVWLPISPGEGKFQISQNMAWRGGTSDLRIDVSQPPPGHAIEGVDMMRYGQAEVVIYEDRNDNDELDVRLGNKSPDRVLGRADGFRVWWLGDGTPAPPTARGYKPLRQGWSVTYGPITNDAFEPGDCAPDPTPGGQYHTRCNLRVKEPAADVTPEDMITITASGDAWLQSYACLGFWGTSSEKTVEWRDDTPGWESPELRKLICNEDTCDCKDKVCPLDLPVTGRTPAPVIKCDADKKAYTWKDCVQDPELCGTVFCHYGHGELDPTKPVPANWPCK